MIKNYKRNPCKKENNWMARRGECAGRTDTEAETPILWPPDVKNQLIRKDPEAGKDWRQKDKGMTEDEMVSPTWWTWVWVGSGSWWWTGRPGVLQSMGSQRVGHDWATELNFPHTFVSLLTLYKRKFCDLEYLRETTSEQFCHAIYWQAEGNIL